MRFPWLAALLVALATAGCSARSSSGSDGGGTGFDAHARLDAGLDGGPTPCESDTDCDDDIECTADLCGVGGLCNNTPLDETCPEGQFCSPARGCSEGCESDADCSDGIFCNGAELCVAGDCFDGDPADCDDGNPCTTDTCDTSFDGCSYEVAEGCDAGIPSADAGVPCDDFEAPTHYSGDFRFLPVQASSCLSATYSIDEVSFSISGDTLEVQADRFTLTQSPVPTGPDFSVTFTQSDCAVYELEGTFSCADRFDGTWRATMMGSCGICSNQNASIVGIRQ